MNKFQNLTREQLRNAWEAAYEAYKVTKDDRLKPVLDELFDAYFVKNRY